MRKAISTDVAHVLNISHEDLITTIRCILFDSEYSNSSEFTPFYSENKKPIYYFITEIGIKLICHYQKKPNFWKTLPKVEQCRLLKYVS